MSRRRFALVVGLGIAALGLLVWMALPAAGPASRSPAAAGRTPAPARRSSAPAPGARLGPPAAGWEGADQGAPAAAAPELPDEVPADLRRVEALATPPQPSRAAPAASPITAAAWSADYERATCACRTRSCVREIQDGFLASLRDVTYDAERDEERYAASAREAVRCYLALPEES